MGWRYLPKITPVAGQKGFVCGDVFVPIETEAPSAYKKGVVVPMATTSDPVPSEGLILDFPCTSNTAKTGQEFTAKGAVYKDDSAYFAGSLTGIISNKKASELFAGITEQISFCCSFNTYDTAKWQEILSCTESGGFSVGINSDSHFGAFQVGLYAGGSYADYKAFDVFENILPNTWYFCCITYDGSNIKVYLNSELKSTVAKSGQIKFPSNSATFIIGAEPLGSGSIDRDCFYGEISNVLVYNRALTEDEVLFLNKKFSKKQIFIPLEEVQPEEGAEFEKSSEEMPSEGLILHVPLAQSATEDELGNELSEIGNVAFTTVEGIPCADISDTSAVGGTHITIRAPALSATGAVPVSFSFWVAAYEIPSYKNEFFYYGRRHENVVPDYESMFVEIRKNNRFSTNFGKSILEAYPGFHHIAYMCTGTKTLFYVDGGLQYSDNMVWDYVGNTPIYLSGGYFAGFRMYNRALSVTEIRELAREWKKPVPDPIGVSGILISSSNTISAGKFHKNELAEIPSSGLLLHASLEQDSETAETGQTFTKSGNVTFETVQGMKCAHFDGNSYWQVPFESELAGNTAKAVSLWMWGTKNITENIQTWAFGVGYWSRAQAFGVGQATASSYSNRFYATMYGGDCVPPSPLATSDFHHIVFQYDLSKTELFVDGVKVSEQNYSSANTSSSYPITIGWNGMNVTYNKRFTGYISGVRVYNRALSEMEIQNLSNEWQGTGRTNKIFIPVMDKIETEPTMFEKIVAAVNENSGIEYTTTVSEFGEFSDSSKWNGGVLAPNGKIYGIPRDSRMILEINPETRTASTFQSLSSSGNKWRGGILALNGRIYGIPFNTSTILEISFDWSGQPFTTEICTSSFLNKF